MMLPTKLNQWIHIRATVESNWPGVETVRCGMHIMYKQDVEGFVQAMVECVSAIPEAKRVDHYRSLVNRAHFVQSRGNRAESSEPLPLRAEKCGLRLVYQRDMQELQETIIKCVTSPFDNNMEYIHQLIADETRSIEQTTESGCSYRDPYPERLSTPIYQRQSSGSGISFEEQLPRSLPVINYVDLFKKYYQVLFLCLSLSLDTIFLFYRSLIDALYILLASLQLKSRNGSAITGMGTT
jgi:hypothetical protein